MIGDSRMTLDRTRGFFLDESLFAGQPSLSADSRLGPREFRISIPARPVREEPQ